MASGSGTLDYRCPACPRHEQRPTPARPGKRPPIVMHACVGTGLWTAMVRDGDLVRVRIVPREDYVNGALATYDHQGRAVMAVSYDRPDGSNDLIVYPDAAKVSVRI